MLVLLQIKKWGLDCELVEKKVLMMDWMVNWMADLKDLEKDQLMVVVMGCQMVGSQVELVQKKVVTTGSKADWKVVWKAVEKD